MKSAEPYAYGRFNVNYLRITKGFNQRDLYSFYVVQMSQAKLYRKEIRSIRPKEIEDNT